MTIPYVFQNAGDYTVTIQTRIIGDPKYEATPLIASFDITVVSQLQVVFSNNYTILYITIIAAVAGGAGLFIYAWKKM